MSGFYLQCDGTTKLVKLPEYLQFRHREMLDNTWIKRFGIRCAWTQPNSLLSSDDRRLVMLVDQINVDPSSRYDLLRVNLSLQEMLGITIRGPVLIFVTEPYLERSSKERTLKLGMSLKECRKEIPFLLSCFEYLENEYQDDVYYWILPGLKPGVRKDPKQLARLRNIAEKLDIEDTRLAILHE